MQTPFSNNYHKFTIADCRIYYTGFIIQGKAQLRQHLILYNRHNTNTSWESIETKKSRTQTNHGLRNILGAAYAPKGFYIYITVSSYYTPRCG